MKKLLVSMVTLLLLLSGCAKNGMALNTLGGNDVSRVFQNGTVISQKKVIIDDTETAILTGAAAGAVGGQVIQGNTQSTLIGIAIGTIAGAIIGNEIEAYETLIQSEGKEYTAYLKKSLRSGTKVEFTLKENKLKNVTVL